MDPLLVGGALKLFGGIFGSNKAAKEDAKTRAFNAREARLADKRAWRYKNAEYKKVWKREDQLAARSTAGALRRQYEKAGFNPLALMGSGVGVQGGPSTVGGTGASFAPAAYNGAAQGQLIADGLTGAVDALSGAYTAQQELDLQKAELDMKHQALADLSRKIALNPNVPGIYGGENAQQYRTAGASNDGSAYTAGNASGEVNQEPLKDPTHLVYRGVRGGTELATGGGIIESLQPYYGDEPSEWVGYLNMLNDIWHSGVLDEAYDPKWGYESKWPRPKPRAYKPEYYKGAPEYVPYNGTSVFRWATE